MTITTQTPSHLWRVDLEQCSLAELWVYKFDHDPVQDGQWHRLNATTSAVYRISDSRLQFLAPAEAIDPGDWSALQRQFHEIGPLATEDSVEVELRFDASGFTMSDRLGLNRPVEGMTRAHLDAAYARLVQLDDEESERTEPQPREQS